MKSDHRPISSNERLGASSNSATKNQGFSLPAARPGRPSENGHEGNRTLTLRWHFLAAGKWLAGQLCRRTSKYPASLRAGGGRGRSNPAILVHPNYRALPDHRMVELGERHHRVGQLFAGASRPELLLRFRPYVSTRAETFPPIHQSLLRR